LKKRKPLSLEEAHALLQEPGWCVQTWHHKRDGEKFRLCHPNKSVTIPEAGLIHISSDMVIQPKGWNDFIQARVVRVCIQHSGHIVLTTEKNAVTGKHGSIVLVRTTKGAKV
jgi:hypothetical protein